MRHSFQDTPRPEEMVVKAAGCYTTSWRHSAAPRLSSQKAALQASRFNLERGQASRHKLPCCLFLSYFATAPVGWSPQYSLRPRTRHREPLGRQFFWCGSKRWTLIEGHVLHGCTLAQTGTNFPARLVKHGDILPFVQSSATNSQKVMAVLWAARWSLHLSQTPRTSSGVPRSLGDSTRSTWKRRLTKSGDNS